MALPFYNWSLTAASNATADSTVNWAEGQAPSTVNDSARAMMASTAAFRDDTSGSLATGGTSTAYTLATNQVFDSLAHLNGKVVAFTPHTTNGATVTLNVDGLGAKPLRAQSGIELQSGVLIQGTPYAALYNNSDQVFYLFGVGANPGIPLGSSIDYWGSSAPTSAFALAYGQAISRSTYATLFSLLSTTYGSGDGSTTFNLPDLRGRIIAGKDDMGGSAASRLSASFFTSPTTLGGTGGSESRQLATSNLPPYTPAGTNGTVTVTSTRGDVAVSPTSSSTGGGQFSIGSTSTNGVTITSTGSGPTFTGTAQGGTSAAFGIIQPTIIANILMRVI
jgi:microcystin-dependent protein